MKATAAIDWGPIPALAEALAGQDADPSTALQHGFPWAVFVNRRLRGDPPPPRQPWWDRLWRWVRALCGWPAPEWHPQSLKALLAETHRWLARLNLEAAVPLFRSTGEPAPPALGAITDAGISCVVAAWLSTRNSAASLALASAILRQPADCLALHLCLERLILLSPHPKVAMSPERVAGGLRRVEVLAAGVALSEDAAGWKLLRGLALSSPLTLIVYGDLFAPDAATADTARWAFQFAGPEPNAEDEGWRTTWLLLLARSMTGVILSPPGVAERLAAAREVVRELDLREPREGVFFLDPAWWLRRAWEKQKERAYARVKSLCAERHGQCVSRLHFLSEVLAVASADLGGVRNEETGEILEPNPLRLGASYVVARTWDMFIRTFIARQTRLLMNEWPDAQAEGRMGEAARDALIFGTGEADAPPASVSENFFRQLTQMSADEQRAMTPGDWTPEQCLRLCNLDAFTLSEGRRVLVGHVGIRSNDLDHAIALLTDYTHAVILPLGPADRRDRPPGLHLARWGEMLARRLPVPSQTRVDVEETIERTSEYEYA